MAVVEVTNEATLVRSESVALFIKNLGPSKVWFDVGTDVTADLSNTGGVPLEPGESMYTQQSSETLYGITEGANDTAYVAFAGS